MPGIKCRAFGSGRFGFLTGGRQLYRPFQEIRHVGAPEGKYRRVAFGVVSAIAARLTALIAPLMPASLGFTAFAAILVTRAGVRGFGDQGFVDQGFGGREALIMTLAGQALRVRVRQRPAAVARSRRRAGLSQPAPIVALVGGIAALTARRGLSLAGVGDQAPRSRPPLAPGRLELELPRRPRPRPAGSSSKPTVGIPSISIRGMVLPSIFSMASTKRPSPWLAMVKAWPSAAGPAGAADAMDIVLGMDGHVEIEDMAEAFDIEAAGGDVAGDEYRNAAVAELLQRLWSGIACARSCHAGVLRRTRSLTKERKRDIHVALAVAEDDRVADVLGTQEMAQQLRACLAARPRPAPAPQGPRAMRAGLPSLPWDSSGRRRPDDGFPGPSSPRRTESGGSSAAFPRCARHPG